MRARAGDGRGDGRGGAACVHSNAPTLRARSCKPNFAYTINEVQEDMQRVFDTGYFAT